MSKVMKCLRLPSIRMSDQLLIEEALFRTSPHSWFLQNTPGHEEKPIIVLGISGKPEELVHLDVAEQNGVRMLKRYSGGGTVYVDNNVIMNSMVFNKDFAPCEGFPKPVMEWTGAVYQRFFGPKFTVHQNDYIHLIDSADDTKFKKCAGNAQAFSKNKFVHHTSFLLHVDGPAMEKYLTNPKRQPEYRAKRKHTDFLVGIREAFPEATEGKTPSQIQDGILTIMGEEADRAGLQMDMVEWNEETKKMLREVVMDYIEGRSTSSNMRSTRYIDRHNNKDIDDFSGALWTPGM